MSQIKIIALMNNKVLVKIEEVGAEVGEPDCKLNNPVILKTEDKITVEEGQKFFLHTLVTKFYKN